MFWSGRADRPEGFDSRWAVISPSGAGGYHRRISDSSQARRCNTSRSGPFSDSRGLVSRLRWRGAAKIFPQAAAELLRSVVAEMERIGERRLIRNPVACVNVGRPEIAQHPLQV